MKKWKTILLFPVIVAALEALVCLSPLSERLDPLALDFWFNIRGPALPPNDVVVVSFDERSYEELGIPLGDPWPRALHARLLKRLAAYGARGVVLDIVLFGPSADAEADQSLAQALHGIPTVLGTDIILQRSGDYDLEQLLEIYKPFAQAASLGLVKLPEDYGSLIRRFVSPQLSRLTMPALSLAGARILSPQSSAPGPRDYLNFYGPARTMPSYSYYMLLDDKSPLPAALFKDKLVFVGSAMNSSSGFDPVDAFNTPFRGPKTYGVEIHATAAANIAHGEWIRRGHLPTELAALCAVAAVLTAGFVMLPPLAGGLLLAGIALLWAVCGYLLMLSGFFLPGLSMLGLVLPAAYLSTLCGHYIATRLRQQQVMRAFSCYLSPEMAKMMAQREEPLALGGDEIDGTVLFTDIENFTGISEAMKPRDVSVMLNEYFSAVLDTVFRNSGTIIKFIGDGVMVLWGAPIRITNHATFAVRAAREIQEEAQRFNASGRFPPLHTRIGINSGPMLAGNLGATQRFDFTAIGDAVNVASRLEGLNKYLHTEILMTDSVRRAAGELNDTLWMGTVQVAGKTRPAEIFALFSKRPDTALQTRWLEALRAFQERDWERSLAAFSAIAGLDSALAHAARFYVERIKGEPEAGLTTGMKGQIVLHRK